MEFTRFNLSLPKMPSVIMIKQLNGGLVMSKRQQLLCFSTFRQSELFCYEKGTLMKLSYGMLKESSHGHMRRGVRNNKKGG